MTNSCCSGLRENLDFPGFLQKKFHNINYWFDQVSKKLKFSSQEALKYNQYLSRLIKIVDCLLKYTTLRLMEIMNPHKPVWAVPRLGEI